ncbi:hypothetical protein GCM10010234_79020 [Streptomyces hawaiiensis]|uniref:hypothetical protein n=1 Tax=Streptomyces hawaiiensis TaxID=67305 RepID=UPI0031D8D4A5
MNWTTPSGETAGFRDAPDGLCMPVELHSSNIRNNTVGYVRMFTSTTRESCDTNGTTYLLRPGQVWGGEFTSFLVGG